MAIPPLPGPLTPAIPLRDWYAGMAMQAMVTNFKAPIAADTLAQIVAGAFQIADALIEEGLLPTPSRRGPWA